MALAITFFKLICKRKCFTYTNRYHMIRNVYKTHVKPSLPRLRKNITRIIQCFSVSLHICNPQDRVHNLRDPVWNKKSHCLVENYQEFQDDISRPLNRGEDLSTHRVPCNCTSHMLIMLGLVVPSITKRIFYRCAEFSRYESHSFSRLPDICSKDIVYWEYLEFVNMLYA